MPSYSLTRLTLYQFIEKYSYNFLLFILICTIRKIKDSMYVVEYHQRFWIVVWNINALTNINLSRPWIFWSCNTYDKQLTFFSWEIGWCKVCFAKLVLWNDLLICLKKKPGYILVILIEKNFVNSSLLITIWRSKDFPYFTLKADCCNFFTCIYV